MIWNCGILPENWSIKTLLSKHGSRPYNPDIANVFFRAGEIEAWGKEWNESFPLVKKPDVKNRNLNMMEQVFG